MTRAFTALLMLAFLGLPARADCLLLKRNGRLQTWGIPSEVGGVEITPENIELYQDQSTGSIETEGYDTVTAKKRDNAKTESFPRSEVVKVFYSTEPEELGNGYASMAAGDFLPAVNDFRDVVNAAGVRDAYKYQALRQIGICYYNAGRVADCIKHYEEWPAVNARQTPEVYRLLADIYIAQKKYDQARARYKMITELPGIPDGWKYLARLGAVKVDTAERKYDDAERAAATIAREAQGKTDLADASVFALVLQAEAIWRGGKNDRLPEASKILERAAAVEGAEPDTRAFLFLTQGNVLYAQGMVEEARFPYMRAALMYPNTGYEGLAYFNAGQCFLDMSMRLDGKEQEKSDKLLVKGMRLLATAAGNYKVGDAAKRYRENKKRYDEIMAKEGAAGE